MKATALDPHLTVNVLRWIARVSAVLLVATTVLYVLLEGLPGPASLDPAKQLMFLAFGVVLVGLLVGLRWEGIGGGAVLGGLLAYLLINLEQTDPLPVWAIPLFAVPGVLFLVTCFLGSRYRSVRTPRV